MTMLADKIINYRANNKMTQVDFAKFVGVSAGTIFNIENDKKKARKVTERNILNKIGED